MSGVLIFGLVGSDNDVADNASAAGRNVDSVASNDCMIKRLVKNGSTYIFEYEKHTLLCLFCLHGQLTRCEPASGACEGDGKVWPSLDSVKTDGDYIRGFWVESTNNHFYSEMQYLNPQWQCLSRTPNAMPTVPAFVTLTSTLLLLLRTYVVAVTPLQASGEVKEDDKMLPWFIWWDIQLSGFNPTNLITKRKKK